MRAPRRTAAALLFSLCCTNASAAYNAAFCNLVAGTLTFTMSANGTQLVGADTFCGLALGRRS
jgi:hypothetical protein